MGVSQERTVAELAVFYLVTGLIFCLHCSRKQKSSFTNVGTIYAQRIECSRGTVAQEKRKLKKSKLGDGILHLLNVPSCDWNVFFFFFIQSLDSVHMFDQRTAWGNISNRILPLLGHLHLDILGVLEDQ